MERNGPIVTSEECLYLARAHFQLDTEHGKIDESEGYGEIDWADPVSGANYLSMPNRLERIEKSL